jgi:hypothetical protein
MKIGMRDLKNDVMFQLSVASVLDRIYATSAITHLVGGVAGENCEKFGLVTRDHERLLLTFVGDACSGLAADLMPYMAECRLDDAGKPDGLVDFVIRLPSGIVDGVAMSLRRRMESAVAFNVLESVWLGRDVEMTEYYRARAVTAVEEVKSCIKRIPVGPLRLVAHW